MSITVNRHPVLGILFGLSAVLGTVLGSGCGLVPVARSVVQSAREVRDLRQPGADTVDESYARSLLENAGQDAQKSVGVVVAEPVAQNVPRELAEFGVGCGRWLHLHTGGHGELGRTPLWGSVADVRKLLQRPDIRLTSADATRFADLAGVTHIALGTISGTQARTTLSYQLYQTQPKLQKVGSVLTNSGTRDEVIKKLPQMSRSLAKSLGVQSPRVPVPQIAASDFTLLGQVPWKADQPVAANLVLRLAALSAREPLAAVLFLRSGKPRANKAELATALSNLMKHASGNTIAVADVARFYVADIAPHQKVVTGLRARYPKSYLAATSAMQLHKSAGNWKLAQSAAEDAVRAAPQNASAWLDLNALIGSYAQSIRGSAYSAEMTPAQRVVWQLYPQRLAAAWRATQLTPQDSYAWSEVAEAATFNGNSALADRALWKAYALDKFNNSVYSWGLQMYQPKWGGDRKKLLQIARLAVQYADPHNFPADDLVDAIFYGSLKEYREELLTAAIKRSPTSVIANYEYGALYHYDKRLYKTAEKHYRIALAGDPQYARALGSLGDLHYFVKRDLAGAGRLYQQAVTSDPGDSALRDKLKKFTQSTAPATASK